MVPIPLLRLNFSPRNIIISGRVVCRSQAAGISSFAGRIGGLIAPFTSLMVRILLCSTFLPAKARNYVFTDIGLCVCLSVCVCVSVTTITKRIVDGFVPNFMERFLGGKGRPSSCFVTIGQKTP